MLELHENATAIIFIRLVKAVDKTVCTHKAATTIGRFFHDFGQKANVS